MAKNHDFFVSFGSNAGEFARGLGQELNPARGAVKQMQVDMQKVVTAARASRQAAETAAAAAAKAAGSVPGGQGGTVTTPGGQVIDTSFFNGLKTDLARHTTDVEQVIAKMSSAANLMEQAAKTFKPAGTRRSRSEAQVESPTTQANIARQFIKNSGVIDTMRKGGPTKARGSLGYEQNFNPQRYTLGGKPLSWADIQQFTRGNAPRTSTGGVADRVTLTGTPEVVIREASFAKVVKAVEKGNQHAKATRTAVDAILAHLRSGGGGGGGGTAAPSGPTGPAPKRDSQQAQINQTEHQIAKRQRLADLKKELTRVQTGGDFDAELYERATAGSKRLQKAGEAGTFGGDAYAKRLQNAIDSLTRELKGVKRVKGLRASLESGEPVATAPTPQARPRAAAVTATSAQGEELNFAKLAQVDADINEIKALLKGATGDVAEAAKETLAKLKASRDEISAGLTAATKEAGLSKAEAKAARQAAAAEEKKQRPSSRLSQQQRADTARDLALGESESHLKRRTRPELERIARSFGQEGYALPFDPSATKYNGERVTNDVLVREIQAARARFDAAGGETLHSLRTSGNVVATEVGPEAKRMTKAIAKAMKRTREEAEALERIARNREGGGQSQITMIGVRRGRGDSPEIDRNAGNIVRQDKVAKGNVQRSGEFATSAGRDEIRNAEQVELAYRKRTGEANLAQALAFARVGGEAFNPHDPAGAAAQIKGKGPAAKAAQDNLRALRRATAAIDQAMVDFIKLDDQVKKLDKAMDRAERELDKIDKLAAPTVQDDARRAQLQAELDDMNTRNERLRGRRDEIMLGPGVPAYEMDNPEYRRGAMTRHTMYGQQQELARDARGVSREEYEARQTVRGGLFDALFGSRMKPWIGSGRTGVLGPESYTRAFPGVRISNQNGLQALDPSSVDPKLRKVADTALRKYATALERSLEQGLHPTEQAQRVIEATKSAEEWLKAYDRLGVGLRKADIDPRTGMLTYTGNQGDILRPQAGLKSPAGERPAVPERKLDQIAALLEGQPGPVIRDRKGLARLAGLSGVESLAGGGQLAGGVEKVARQRLYDLRAMASMNASAGPQRELIAAVQKAAADLRAAAKATMKPDRFATYKTDPQAVLAALPPQFQETLSTRARRGLGLKWQVRDIESGKATERLDVAQRTMADPKQVALMGQLDTIFAVIDREAREYAAAQKANTESTKANTAATKGNTERKKKDKPELVASTAPPGATPPGGGGGGDDGGAVLPGGGNNILERILKRLELIHTTLRTGVQTKGGPATSGAARTIAGARRKDEVAAPRAATSATGTNDTAAAFAAADDQRNKAKAKREQGQIKGSGVDRDALSAANLAVIYGRLSAATRKYVDELRALQAVNAPAAAINAKQVQLYSAMSNELGQLQVSTRGVRNSFKEVVADTGGRINEYGINQISRSTAIADTGGRRRGRMIGADLGDGMGEGAMDAFASRLFGNNGFWSRVMNSTGTFIIRNFTAGFVFGLTAALQDVVAQAIETESTFIRVSHALESTGRSAAGLRADLQDISTDYGVALLDVYNTAAGLTGLFESNDEIAGATRVVAQLQMISNGALNAQEAMGALASISSAFGMTGVEGLEHIADVLTTIQNRLGVNLEVSAEGVGRLAGLAAQLELSFEETAVYVSEIAKRTNQTGAAAGEQFSRIVSVMQTGRGQRVLTENLGGTGIDVELQSGQYSDAIRILMENYEGLDKAQQDQIATTLGGQRQAASLAALLKDGAGALDTVAAAQYSRGTADERAAKIAETLNNQLRIMQSNFVNLGAAVVQSGVLSFFAVALKSVNWLMGTVNDLLATMNDFASRNPFIDFLKNVAMGALGALVALRLVRASIAGVRAAMKADTVGGAVTRGLIGPVTGAPGAMPGTADDAETRRRTMRERAAAGWQRASLAPPLTRDSIGSFRNSRLADPLAGPTSALGRGMERVTAGPLRTFGTGLDRLSAAMRATALNQLTVGGLDRRAQGSYNVSRAAGAGGTFLGRAATGMEYLLRGRGDIIADRAASSLRTGQTALQLRGLAAQESGRTVAPRALNALGAAAGGTARVLDGAGAAMRRLSFNGAAMQGALAGISLVMTAVIMEMVRAEQFGRDVENAYKSRFTEEGRASEDEKRERYVGPSTDLARQNREGAQGFTGYMRALGDFYNPTNLFRTTDEIASRAAGELDAGTQGGLDTLEQSIFERTRALGERARAGESTLGAVTDQQTAILAEIDAKAKEINADDSLSGPQKAQALADLERMAKFVDDTAGIIGRQVEGIGNLERLTTSRIQELTSLAGTLASSPTAGANYGEAMGSLMAAQGPGPNSGMTRAFETLTSGNGSTADILRAQLSINNQAVDQARINLDTAVASGMEEDIQERAQVLMGLLTTGEQLRRQAAEAEAAAASEMATFLANTGDYAGAAAALDAAAAATRERVAASQRQRTTGNARKPSPFMVGGGNQGGPGQGQGVLAPTALLTPDEEIRLLNEAAQKEAQAAEQAITEANATDRASLRGNRNQVQVAEIQQRMAEKRLQVLRERKASDELIQAAEDQVAQAALAAEDASMAVANAMDAANAAGIRGAEARAGAERRNAGNALQRLRDAGYGEDTVEVQGAIATLKNSRMAQGDATQARIQSGYQMRAAGMLNAVSRAQEEEAGAWQAVTDARKKYGQNTAEYNSALAAARSASQGTAQAVEDQNAAQRELALAMIPPGDMQGRAAQTLSNALAAQAAAAKFGTSSAQYRQATIAVIDAQRAVDDAAFQMLQGQQAINLAMLEYGGHTVEAARERVRQAEAALTRALQQSGGADSPDVRNARAAVIQAQGGERDTVFQDQMNSIDYQQQMDQITARGAIGLLQQLLNMKDLTEEQRRSVLLKIKGLQDELSSTMEGVFNLPGEIKVPTPYEVRRAIGVDDMIQSMKDATSTSAISAAMPSASNPAQILAEIKGALAAGSANSVAGAVQDYSNSNNNVTINGASFEQVVAYLNQYLGAGAQVVRTNAGRKGY